MNGKFQGPPQSALPANIHSFRTEFLDAPNLHPKKAFIIGAIDKEIRLSFARRIRDTLPKPYHFLIPQSKEDDVPEFKYRNEKTPYAREGREVHALIKKKGPEEEIQKVIDRIHEQAAEHGVDNPLIPSTDAYMTSICFFGCKSLSHVLSCIERCKERLIQIGQQSEAARRQIIQSVVEYWHEQPGVAVNIVDKLLNYTILTPESVIIWALSPEQIGNGGVLSETWRYEMVAATVRKVTNRVRQIAAHKVNSGPDLPAEAVQSIDEVFNKERDVEMQHLFKLIIDYVGPVSQGSSDGMIEADGLSEEDTNYVKAWGQRWLCVFRRKAKVEQAVVGPEAVATQMVVADLIRKLDARKEKEQREKEEREEAERVARAERFAAEEEKKRAEEVATNGNGMMPEPDNLDVAPDNAMVE
jgi:nuclear cap-binding protein subunit 1